MGTPEIEKIYVEYFSDVYRYVLSLCREEDMAKEITQETFFKALRHIDKFNGSCKFYVWLCQIAKNTYFKAKAKQKRAAARLEADAPDPAIDVEKAYLDGEDARKIHILLHDLCEPYKEVFMLRVFGELPFSQIGELFGKTDNWARLIFYRAKKRIQEGMK